MAWSREVINALLAADAAKSAGHQAMVRLLLPIQMDMAEKEKDRQSAREIVDLQYKYAMEEKSYQRDTDLQKAKSDYQKAIDAAVLNHPEKVPKEIATMGNTTAYTLTNDLLGGVLSGFSEEKLQYDERLLQDTKAWIALSPEEKKTYYENLKTGIPDRFVPYARQYGMMGDNPKSYLDAVGIDQEFIEELASLRAQKEIKRNYPKSSLAGLISGGTDDQVAGILPKLEGKINSDYSTLVNGFPTTYDPKTQEPISYSGGAMDAIIKELNSVVGQGGGINPPTLEQMSDEQLADEIRKLNGGVP